MQKIAPRRRLKRFAEVTGRLGVNRQVRRLAESLNLAEAQNPNVNLSYFTMAVPMHLSDDEKSERLSEMADTVTAVGERSDVILLAMWVSPTTE